MIPDTLRMQIDQWLDGDLSLAEEALLKEQLETLPEAVEFFSDRALLHSMLSKSALIAFPELDVLLETSVSGVPADTPLIPARGGIIPTWLWAPFATAICLLLISLFFLPTVFANPVGLVRKTLAEYRSTIDRCYIVKVEGEGRLRRSRLKGRIVPTDSKLWVRGKSFVQIFDSSDNTLIWGRDEQGSVWFTIAGKSAAVFEADRVPDALQELCDLRTLDMATLLESLLRDYQLEYAERIDGIHTIIANPLAKVSHTKYGTVEIEIDAPSRLVRRVTLDRLKEDRVVAVISFSLDDIQQREATFYDVQTHLAGNADLLGEGSKLGDRLELLKEFLQKLRSPQSAKSNGVSEQVK